MRIITVTIDEVRISVVQDYVPKSSTPKAVEVETRLMVAIHAAILSSGDLEMREMERIGQVKRIGGEPGLTWDHYEGGPLL